MRTRAWVYAGIGAVSLAGATLAFAHHSVLGQFDPRKRMELNGVISRVDWINPHIYVYLDVEEESGETTTWRLESVPPAYLYKAGVTQEMLMAAGESVNIDVILARDETQNLGFIIKIHYPDGHYYQLSDDE